MTRSHQTNIYPETEKYEEKQEQPPHVPTNIEPTKGVS